MHELGLGLNAATHAIIVAHALKRVQQQKGFTKVNAIDYLSSRLTTMKLLGTVEKTFKLSPSVACSPSSTIAEEFISSTLNVDTSSVSTGTSSSTSNKQTTNATRANMNKRTSSTPSTTCKNNLKNIKSSRQSKPPKPTRKRSKEEDTKRSKEEDTNVDAKVAEKALLVKEQTHAEAAQNQRNCKTPSPSVARLGVKRVGISSSHRDELEVQAQPAKRQRLDSI